MKIYLIGVYQDPASKPLAIKIGVARDVAGRLESLQTGNHLECRVMATWTAESDKRARALELRAHRRFNSHRIRGEWFKPYVTLYVDFFNTLLAQEVNHRTVNQDRYPCQRVDDQIFAENPWLKTL